MPKRFALLFGACALAAAPTATARGQAGNRSASPTGREPRLVWTARQQAVWSRMRAENHPWWRLIRRNADATGTRAERYADFGQWATLAFQITGERPYAARAWAKIAPVMAKAPPNADFAREYFAEYALMYDWLRPALSTDQRAAYLDGLNRWCRWSLGAGTPKYVGGFSTPDSDQTIGQYFGLAFVDLATAPEAPEAGRYLRATAEKSPPIPVGGLDPSGPGRSTVRDALADYVRAAEGGVWVEGSEYNQGTLALLLMGAAGVKTATGVDHFPEVTRLARRLALAQIAEVTPDLNDAYQWGDVEHPRQFRQRLYKRVTLLGMLAGLCRDDPVGPYLQRLIRDLADRYGATGHDTAEPWWRMFYVYDPYAPTAARPGPAEAAALDARGVGVLLARSGWGPGDSLFAASMPRRLALHHEVEAFGDFQLYRRGEWALTHPLGYDGPPLAGEGNNAMLIAGLSSTRGGTRGPLGSEFGPDGSYAYDVGATSGPYYDRSYYAPPPEFLHEWTRSLIYLPSRDGSCDSVVIYDRVDAESPRALPGYTRYRDNDRKRIDAAPALKQWIIHAPVEPSVGPEGVSWSTPRGQRVRVTTLRPVGARRAVVDERALWANDYHVEPSERKWQVRIMPPADRRWDTFLHVLQAADRGAAGGVTLVRAPGGEVEGAVLARDRSSDVLALFGAREGRRIVSTGFEVRWAGGRGRTEVLCADLDPSHRWSTRADGAPPVVLKVGAAGLGRRVVDGAGEHSLRFQAD